MGQRHTLHGRIVLTGVRLTINNFATLFFLVGGMRSTKCYSSCWSGVCSIASTTNHSNLLLVVICKNKGRVGIERFENRNS